MRYIRFLKTPRIVEENDSTNVHIYALITITSDLGDSFLPCDVDLSAELWSQSNAKAPKLQKMVKWSSSMRSLPISIPLPRRFVGWPVRMRVGVELNSVSDLLEGFHISASDDPAIVSAWSAAIDPLNGTKEAVKRIERCFFTPTVSPVSIWEETGESIARHLWDAGLSTCIHMDQIISLALENESFRNALYSGSGKALQVIELGTGCGMVGVEIARLLPNASVLLTDLSDAEEIANLNIAQNTPLASSRTAFQTLEWGKPLPTSIEMQTFDLVIASDCTYNPDSSPMLVQTIAQLVLRSFKAAVMVSMKVRHSSEDVFFALMAEAGFIVEKKLALPLPGDYSIDEDTVDVFLFRADSQLSMKSFVEMHSG